MGKITESALELVGKTPLLRASRYAKNVGAEQADVLVKLEYLNPAGSGSNSSAAGIAASMVGSPYVWGGSSPAGFDCSGLTSYAYAQAGISIPRTAGGQASVGSAVSYGNMQPGDLIVWSGGAHVSIYVGGGQMVHATNPSTGVITSSVSFWSNNSGQSITAIRRP